MKRINIDILHGSIKQINMFFVAKGESERYSLRINRDDYSITNKNGIAICTGDLNECLYFVNGATNIVSNLYITSPKKQNVEIVDEEVSFSDRLK